MASEEARDQVLDARRQALGRMWAARERAINAGLELWDDERLGQELVLRRGEDVVGGLADLIGRPES